MKKRVVFIEPKAEASFAYGHFLKKWPLLGCLTLATILQKRGHDVTVYSENLTGSVLDDDDVIADLLDADFVGITALSTSVARAYQIATLLKDTGLKGRLVMGGSHASFMPEEALQYVPCVVRGEAETLIADLVESEQAPERLLTGLPVSNLDDLPTPELRLVYGHDQLWRTSLWKEDYHVPMATARGCPHGCSYCSVTEMFGRRYRTRSVDKVVEDIMTYYDRGFRSFFFYDDNFTGNRSRTRELLERIAPLDIHWIAQCRIDFPWIDPASRSRVDKDLMNAIKSSGVDLMVIGYETIDDQTARDWHKGYKGTRPLVKRMEEDTRILHDYGVWVHGAFVMGPRQDLNTFESVLDFSNRNLINSIQISLLTPFPGTKLMAKMKDDVIFKNFPHDWKYFDGAHLTFHHKKVGNKAMQEALLKYHRKYYHGAIHQWDRLRRMILGPGGIYKRAVRGVHSALRVRRMIKDWEAETAAFLEETARRGEHYLYPAGHAPIDSPL